MFGGSNAHLQGIWKGMTGYGVFTYLLRFACLVVGKCSKNIPQVLQNGDESHGRK